MAKVWINPNFKGIYKDEKEEKLKTVSPVKQKEKEKDISPSERFIVKKIQDRRIVEIKFIDDEIRKGFIQWSDERYLKFKDVELQEKIIIEKRWIKYIK